MVFRRFFLKIFALILLICIFGAVTIWSFTQEHLVISQYILLAFWLLTTYLFIRSLFQALNPMEKFLHALHTDDLIKIPPGKHLLAPEINNTYRYVQNVIKNIRKNKEEIHHLYQTSINHSGTGLMVFNKNGDIRIINKAAKKIFDLEPFLNIKKLSIYNSDLPNFLVDKNQKKGLIKITSHNKLQKLIVHLQDFILKEEELRVASFQNISDELEKEELLAWKKLLHVMTHEIMNSVTPMKTLSYSLYGSFKNDNHTIKPEMLSQEQLDDLQEGLGAMNTRITGMMKFVDSFRRLYKIPDPEFKEWKIGTILSEVKRILIKDLEKENITLRINDEVNNTILCDKEMITQILINLVKNAAEAINTSKTPKIEIIVSQNLKETYIKVCDNGKGMNEEELQNCFVPFYSTKENGNGVGLYYSRMIALLHKGNLKAESEYGKGSTFTLTI